MTEIELELKNELERVTATALYDAYEVSYEITEAIVRLMEAKGVKRAQLARTMGVSRSYVTQVLSGSVNITIRKFVEVCHALSENPRAVLADCFQAYHTPLAQVDTRWSVELETRHSTVTTLEPEASDLIPNFHYYLSNPPGRMHTPGETQAA